MGQSPRRASGKQKRRWVLAGLCDDQRSRIAAVAEVRGIAIRIRRCGVGDRQKVHESAGGLTPKAERTRALVANARRHVFRVDLAVRPQSRAPELLHI